MIDTHMHVLPGIDDEAASLEVSGDDDETIARARLGSTRWWRRRI